GSTEPGQTAELKVDDGSAEGGLLSDGRMMVNRLTPPSYPATLRSIRVLFLRFQDQPDPTGQPITLVYFTDPGGSGQPPGGAQITRINATVPGISSSNFFEFQIPNGPTINSGDFYVGYRAPSPHMGVGFTIDGNSQAQNRSFRSLDDGATFQGPITVQGFNAANALIRAMVSIGGSCNYSISPTSQSFNASGGAGSVNVATTTGCAWTAAVNNAPWITITSGSSGTGNGTVNYSVAANTTTSSRTGTITITGQTFTVNQAGGTSGSDVALTSGVPQTGSLPAPSVQLSQQYFIPVSSGATQLRIALSGNQDVDLFARVGQRITLDGGMLMSDYKSDSLSGNEEINVTPSSSPPLRAANYYIVVANCGPGAASFTVTATVTTGQPSAASVSAASSPSNATVNVTRDETLVTTGAVRRDGRTTNTVRVTF
ncbi:MAG: BACON domain-containing protein, partial [Blastocatellia bacterium]